MNRSPLLQRFLLSCCLLTPLLFSAHAAELIWDANPPGVPDDGAGIWNTTTANWYNGTTDAAWVNANNDIAVIGASNGAAGTISLGSLITAGGLKFNSPGSGTYTIAPTASETLTLTGAATVETNVDAIISAQLKGTAGLNKTGAGKLTLTNSSTGAYTGTTTVSAGTLSFTSTNAIGGNGSTRTIAIAGGATLEYSGTANASSFNQQLSISTGTVTLSANAAGTGGITFGGAISLTGTGARTVVLTGGSRPGGLNGVLADGAGGDTSVEKNGSNTWTLRGVNTYTGNTTVNAGTLTLNDDAGLRFEILGDGVNNSILGSGNVVLNGDFTFDLSAAATAAGSMWQIVDVASLTETFGTTFTVNGFTESGNVWTLGSYQFDEATGYLTVVPEPGSLLLIGLGLCCVVWRRRVRRL